MEIGVPRFIVSDDDTQFTSQEFKNFTRRWDIQHRITSPNNAQSSGQAECFVQTIKNSLTKAMGRRGRPTFSHPFVNHNTLETQSTLTHGTVEL